MTFPKKNFSKPLWFNVPLAFRPIDPALGNISDTCALSQSILTFLMSRGAYRLHFHTGSSCLQEFEIKFSPFSVATSLWRGYATWRTLKVCFQKKNGGKEKSIFVNHKKASLLSKMDSLYFLPFFKGERLGDVNGNALLLKALEANFHLTCNWSLGPWLSPSKRSIIASGREIF